MIVEFEKKKVAPAGADHAALYQDGMPGDQFHPRSLARRLILEARRRRADPSEGSIVYHDTIPNFPGYLFLDAMTPLIDLGWATQFGMLGLILTPEGAAAADWEVDALFPPDLDGWGRR